METATRNEVVLVGRLAAPAEEKQMPSGDLMVVWRLIVDRPPSRRKLPEGVKETKVDSLECVAWAAGIQRAALGWLAGDVVAVEGALHRRFWQSPNGASSRYAVEVAKAKRVAKAA